MVKAYVMLRIVLCLILSACLGGCLTEDAATPPSIIAVALGDGTELVYVPEIGYPILETQLTIRVHGGDIPRLDYQYRHPQRPEFDTDVILSIERDGSLRKSTFDCAPSFPAAENDGCDAHLAGYSNANGVVGGLFGLTLLAGLGHGSGHVERPFLAGTRWVVGRFNVEQVGPDALEVSAADEETRGLPYPIAELTDPIANCSIFTGRVRVHARTGVPEHCLVADEEGEYGWRLAAATHLGGPAFVAEIPAMKPSGGSARMPDFAGDAELPFGLQEALREASARDATVADFLARDPYLADSGMGISGGQSTGPCNTACWKSEYWYWRIRLEAQGDGLSFWITKKVESPGNIETFAVSEVTLTDAPSLVREFPAAIVSLGSVWKTSADELGFEPFTLHYFTSRVGPDQSVLEPFVRVGFSSGIEGSVVAPTVVYQADGAVALWQAAGAQPTAFIESCACPIDELCC